jgi:hypothetical protein
MTILIILVRIEIRFLMTRRFKSTMNNSQIISVGGMGGSGTRLVAQLLLAAGIDMGNCLNPAFDNLIFTSLFRDIPYDISDKQLAYHYKLLKTIMQGNLLNDVDRNYFLSFINEKKHLRNISHVWEYIQNYKELNNNSDFVQWGWKEPNTSIFLSRLFLIEKDLFYIHVIRHGLDMAYNSKTNLTRRWSKLINGKDFEDTPQFQLKYWINLNKNILELRDKYPNRIYLLNFDELCVSPSESLCSLFDFLGFDQMPIDKEDMKIVKIPDSTGRYKLHDINIFEEKDIDFVSKMGFMI